MIRCPGIAWSAGWAGSALWEPPSARRRCPSTYWPTSIIKGWRPKVYIATTVGNGCCLGAEPAEAAGSDKLKVAYQVFKDEACDVSPKYAPKTVSTDVWKGTQAAWKMLFTKVVILLCFLHGWLKIRDRAKHLKEVFAEVSRRVWDTYRATDRRSLHNACVSLRQWAAGHLTGIVLEKVLDLCGKRDR